MIAVVDIMDSTEDEWLSVIVPEYIVVTSCNKQQSRDHDELIELIVD